MRAKLYKLLVFILLCGLLNKITISCKEKNTEIHTIRGEQIALDSTISENNALQDFIQPYKDEMPDRINEVLCYNPRVLNKNEGDLESALGNLTADICLEMADSIFMAEMGKNLDFALFNHGGLRTTLPKGSITVEKMFQLMPFENKLVITELNSEKMRELIDYLVRGKTAHPMAGIRITLEGDSVKAIEIRGRPYDPNATYFVLTHDYLQNGGNNMNFFKDPVSLYKTDLKVRDAYISYLRNVDTIEAQMDGRFKQIP